MLYSVFKMLSVFDVTLILISNCFQIWIDVIENSFTTHYIMFIINILKIMLCDAYEVKFKLHTNLRFSGVFINSYVVNGPFSWFLQNTTPLSRYCVIFIFRVLVDYWLKYYYTCV